MSQQTEFVLRNDGFWWAPPIDPSDECDYIVRFAGLIGPDDTIESIVAVAADYATLDESEIGTDSTSVVVWLKAAQVKKTVLVAVTILTVGGRTFQRSFKIECKHL
jgi:hypothetical protein